MIRHRSTPAAAGLASIAVAIVLSLFGCAEEVEQTAAPVARPVETVVVAGTAGAPSTFPGSVEASSQVDMSFRVGGPLVELNVMEGDKVREGQVLARIDPRDFELAVNAARAAYESAEADFRRFTALYERQGISATRMNQVRTAREVALAALRTAEAKLADTYMRAPFTGEIGKVFVENFTDVLLKVPVLSLVDVSALQIVVDVPERQIATLDRSVIGRIAATFEAAPDREFELTLQGIASQANVRTRTYRVELLMSQPEGINILPGMTATVTGYPLASADANQRLVVPAKAVRAEADGQQSVWVVDPETSRVHRRAVTTGKITGGAGIEILAGLEGGERIATTGINQLQEDIEVRLRSE
jgi:RND family efflux transporter MFP subunit